jgi:uncharacterized membrane protein YbhN (UPF0104 family)
MNGYRAVMLSALLAVLGYGLFIAWLGIDAVFDALSRISQAGLALILSLSLLNYVVRCARWQWWLRRLDHRVPTRLNALYYFAGFAFTTTPGKAGEVVRSVYLKRDGVSYPTSLAAFFVEKLADLGAMLFLSALAAWHFPRYRLLIALVLALLFAVSMIVHNRYRFNEWLRPLCAPLPARWRAGLAHADHLIGRASVLLRSDVLSASLFLGILAWGAEGLGFYYLLQFLHIETTLAQAIGIYALAMLAGALSFLPGGLGSTEAVMVLLLSLSGAGQAEAVAATLLCRLTTLWFAVALGSIAFLRVETGRRAPADTE